MKRLVKNISFIVKQINNNFYKILIIYKLKKIINIIKKKNMRSRNISKRDFLPTKTGTTDTSNGISFNISYNKTDSKISEVYLSSNTIKKIPETQRIKYKLTSKERKPIDNFLLTEIPSYYSQTERKLIDRKSFLKIEKEKGYKKYNNYHVHILNVMYKKKKKINFDPLSTKKKIDITKYNIDIPKGYDLSSRDEKEDYLDEKKIKEKRVFVGRMENSINHDVIKELNKEFIHEKKNENMIKRNSILKRFSINKKFSSSVNNFKKRVTSANVLKKVEKNRFDIEQIILKNIKTMKEKEKRKKNEEIKKRLFFNKKIHEKLHKEYYPIEQIMKNEFNENKKILFKKNNNLFNEDTYITDINDFSEKFNLKNKIENVKKERKVNIYIPKLHLSEIININALNDNVN